MLRLSVDDLKPGMKVGRAIISGDGRVLLKPGTELKPSYIRHLRRLEVPAVYVINNMAPDVVPPEVVSGQTEMRIRSELQGVMTDLRQHLGNQVRRGLRSMNSDMDSFRVRAAVNDLVDEILTNREVLVHCQDIRSADDYTLGHSVSVCVLGSMVGISLGYDRHRLRDLAIGCLLHDVGKVTLPPDILKKIGPLTPEEAQEVRQHPQRGYCLLSEQPGISLLSAHVAWQHHERFAGGGYPRGLIGAEIHEYARICTIVDCYDALVTDRVYRKGYSPARALRIMTEGSRGFFDPNLLRSFEDNIAPYPVGSMVELSSGETAVVVEVRRGAREQPRLRVLKDALGHVVETPYEINLDAEPRARIVRMVGEEQTGRDSLNWEVDYAV